MFFSELKRIFNCDNISISERLSTVEASFTVNSSNLPAAEEFKNLSIFIPEQDHWIVKIKSYGEDVLEISKYNTVNDDEFSGFTKGLSSDDEIYVSVQIDKKDTSERFSIYDFNSFSQDLLKRSMIEIMGWFSDRLKGKEYLIFEVFDTDVSFSTRTLAFESNTSVADFTPKLSRTHTLKECRDIACFYNMDRFEIVPDDFVIEGIVKNDGGLKELFSKIATVLSLVYVASSASICEANVNLQFVGQRTITPPPININSISKNDRWISIYSWIFTDGNHIDKMLIAHNIICLYCKYDMIINIDDTTLEAIKTNYNLYLKNNVSRYLDLKKDIGHFIQNSVSQVGDYAVSILGKFKSNLIAIFVFLFTVVLTKIGTTQKWTDIFTPHTLYLMEIFALGSIIYMVICVLETNYKLKKIGFSYEEIKNNYKDVFSDLEIKEMFQDDRLYKETKKTIIIGIVIWSIIWGIILLSCVIVIEVFTNSHGLIVWLYNKFCFG